MKKYSFGQAYGLWRSKISLILIELKSPSKNNLSKRIGLLSKGFLSESNTIYNLSINDRKQYLTDYQRRKTRFINGQSSYILSNKIVFDGMINQSVKTADIFYIILDGKIHSTKNSRNIVDFTSLLEHLDKYEKLIFKPFIESDGGRGIFLITINNGEILINNKCVTHQELKTKVEKMNNYIVCEFVQQGDYGQQLFNGVLNTIRIVTMIDPYKGDAFIATAVQRIGTEKCKPVDNWSSGGLSANIDVKTGVLGKAVTYPDNDVLSWYERHPDTHSQIEGVIVPNWTYIKNKVLNLSNQLPYLKYIGWDIVPLDEDILIIEGNNCTDVNLLQVHKPLLSDEQVQQFYRYHGII